MNYTDVWHASIIVWGGSRRLFEKMHEISLQGQGSYIETFLMHAAIQGDYKVATLHGGRCLIMLM